MSVNRKSRSRYSKEGLQKIRKAMHLRWVTAAQEKHKDKFDYKNTESTYRTQKEPEVPILCNRHNAEFSISPQNHLRSDSGGCPDCEFTARSKGSLESERVKFKQWFEMNCSNRLVMLTEFRGMTKEAEFLCLIHKTAKVTKPTNLMTQGQWGCDLCSRVSQTSNQRLTLEDVQNSFRDEMPDYVQIEEVFYDEGRGSSFITIQCSYHGKIEVTKGYLTRSKSKCPVCGNLRTGYAGNRLFDLLTNHSKGDSAWLGVMEIEAFGIRSLKVGVTRRTLMERYGSDLKTVFFSVKLDEVDAYVLENRIKRAFSDHHDLRILKAGMRHGERWGGDTECFWFKQREPIIDFIRSFLDELESKNTDYWKEYENFEVPIFFPRDLSREKDLSNLPQEVVAINPATGNIVDEFPSLSQASRELNIAVSNISKVIRGKARTAGGFRWFLSKDFSPDQIPPAKPHGLSKIVRCIETQKLYVSVTGAGEATNISSSHITSNCKGTRKNAGGYTWEYADVSYEEVLNQMESDVRIVPPTTPSNSSRPVESIDPKTGKVVGRYRSISEATRITKIHNINKVLKGKKGEVGGFCWRYSEHDS